MRNRWAATVTALALAASTMVGTGAQAHCWQAEEVSAATIRDLQSLLMVATLRCQVAGHGMTADYNGFLRANKTTIQQMNDLLKAHFIKAAGAVEGQRAYDAFTTSLANAYGASASSGDVCGSMAALAREAEMMAGSPEGLLLLAQREGVATRVPDGACAAPPPVIAAAPPQTMTVMVPVSVPIGAPLPAGAVLAAATASAPAAAGAAAPATMVAMAQPQPTLVAATVSGER